MDVIYKADYGSIEVFSELEICGKLTTWKLIPGLTLSAV